MSQHALLMPAFFCSALAPFNDDPSGQRALGRLAPPCQCRQAGVRLGEKGEGKDTLTATRFTGTCWVVVDGRTTAVSHTWRPTAQRRRGLVSAHPYRSGVRHEQTRWLGMPDLDLFKLHTTAGRTALISMDAWVLLKGQFVEMIPCCTGTPGDILERLSGAGAVQTKSFKPPLMTSAGRARR